MWKQCYPVVALTALILSSTLTELTYAQSMPSVSPHSMNSVEQRKKVLQDRYQNLSPEDRKVFKSKVQQHMNQNNDLARNPEPSMNALSPQPYGHSPVLPVIKDDSAHMAEQYQGLHNFMNPNEKNVEKQRKIRGYKLGKGEPVPVYSEEEKNGEEKSSLYTKKSVHSTSSSASDPQEKPKPRVNMIY